MHVESDGRIVTTIAEVLGLRPFQGASSGWCDSVNRAAVRTFLTRMGWGGQAVVSLSIADLETCYTDSVACQVMGHKNGCDHSLEHVQAKGLTIAEAEYKPRNEQLLARLKTGLPETIHQAPETHAPVNAPAEAPSFPAPVEKPAADLGPNAKATALAAMLADMMGQRPLDEKRVIELVREHAPKGDIVYHTFSVIGQDKGEERTLDDQPRHALFGDVLAAVGQGLNVMIVGPAGCGKTHLGQQIADALKLSFHFTGAVDSPYNVLGFTDAMGKTVRKPFREAYEHGGVFMFDEIDGSANSALLAFNAGLANGHQDFPDGNVTMHPDFRCIASANTYGRGQDRVYVGRNQLDAASIDRFVVMDMDYDETLERSLFGDSPWASRVHRVRAAVRSLKLRHVVSMRAIAQGSKLLSAGMPQARVEQVTLWKGLDDASVAKIKGAC